MLAASEDPSAREALAPGVVEGVVLVVLVRELSHPIDLDLITWSSLLIRWHAHLGRHAVNAGAERVVMGGDQIVLWVPVGAALTVIAAIDEAATAAAGAKAAAEHSEHDHTHGSPVVIGAGAGPCLLPPVGAPVGPEVSRAYRLASSYEPEGGCFVSAGFLKAVGAPPGTGVMQVRKAERERLGFEFYRLQRYDS